MQLFILENIGDLVHMTFIPKDLMQYTTKNTRY